MQAAEGNDAPPRVVAGAPGVTMRDLLASCAAAKLISTPPPDPAPEAPRERPAVGEHRRAA